MNIKTAFRYQNFLSSLMSEAEVTLLKVKTTQVETHQKSLANADAADETLVVANPDIASGVTANACLSLIFDIFEEKASLDMAISKAKRDSHFDFDTELSINKARRKLIGDLELLVNCHESERMTKAQDYKFNAEGNQTPYTYPVRVVTSLNYDKDKLADELNKIASVADLCSDKADEFVLETIFPFAPKFNIHENFSAIIKKYTE